VGDGKTLDTRPLQAALDDCGQHGGGTVVVPAGRYLTGSLFLRARTTLRLEAGATLLGSPCPEDYPVVESRWEGMDQPAYAALLNGHNLEDIAITGQGVIDGQGETWWDRFNRRALLYPRPRLIEFTSCTRLHIDGIQAVNSPSWTIHPVRCANVSIRGVTVINPPDSPNTDGINPDGCRHVRISDCHISAGDDCIAIKSGSEHERAEGRSPCRDITITNCTLARGHGGVVIGSEMSGGVQNVVISNCIFTSTDRGIRIKSRRGRGGRVENIQASNLIMDGVACPLAINLHYGCGRWGDPLVSDRGAHPVDPGTPQVRHIHLSHITAREVQVAAAFLDGLAEMPVEDVTLSDVSIELSASGQPDYPEMADGLEKRQAAGLIARHVRRLRLDRVAIAGAQLPAVQVSDSQDVELCSVELRSVELRSVELQSLQLPSIELRSGTSPLPAAGTPVIHLHNVSTAFLHARSSPAYPPTGIFLRLGGPQTNHIVLSGPDLDPAWQAVQADADLPPGVVRFLPD
jgi:hypothetical protein